MVFGLILVLGVQTGSSIECYVCNSAYAAEKDCKHLPDPEAFVQDCDVIGNDRGLNYTYCRKIVQNVEGEGRVVRQCASKARLDRTCTERTGTKNIKVSYCECEGNKCNAAPTSHSLSMNIVLLTAVSALLALIFHS